MQRPWGPTWRLASSPARPAAASFGRGGHARRRFLRGRSGGRWLRPRRALCRSCWATHVLLPTSALLRRAALAELIGAALVAKAGGTGHRSIAARLGVPAATVRGWLRRFAARAVDIRGLATSLAYRTDPDLGAMFPGDRRWRTRWRPSASPSEPSPGCWARPPARGK